MVHSSSAEIREIHGKKAGVFTFPCEPACVVWGFITMDKLTEIMAHKRAEIAPLLRPVPAEELAELHARLPRPPSFAEALRRPDGRLAVHFEVKRRSPSAGLDQAGFFRPRPKARRYQGAEADALSILTDEKYFGGQLERSARSHRLFHTATPPAKPCLRKDFMVHPIHGPSGA